jgi:hypothetical protein
MTGREGEGGGGGKYEGECLFHDDRDDNDCDDDNKYYDKEDGKGSCRGADDAGELWHMICQVSFPQTYQELILPTDTYLPTSVFCGGSNFLCCHRKLLRETITARSVPYILMPLPSFYSDSPVV